MARQLQTGNIRMSFCGAVSRVKGVLQKPPMNGFPDKEHPQHQALVRLDWIASGIEPQTVPYRFLDPEELLPIEGSWALFQLFEAIQLRAAWLRGEIEGVEAHDVAETFGKVGHPNERTPYFPQGNIAPALRWALFKRGAFKPRIGWATYLEMGTEEEGVVAKLTLKGREPFRVVLKDIAHFNNDLGIWELAR